jgi:hypothetical protein
MRDRPQIYFGKTGVDLPKLFLEPFSHRVYAAATGPDGGLTEVNGRHIETGESCRYRRFVTNTWRVYRWRIWMMNSVLTTITYVLKRQRMRVCYAPTNESRHTMTTTTIPVGFIWAFHN